MRRSLAFLSVLGAAMLCGSSTSAAAPAFHYSDREDAVIRAFLSDQLAKAKGSPICFKPTLLAVPPGSIAYLRKGPREPSYPASRAYAHDLDTWKKIPRRILGQDRILSTDGDAWKALRPRPATYGECRPLITLGLHRAAVTRSTAMIYGYHGSACSSSTIGANLRNSRGRWTFVHMKGYYAVVGPPGCARLPISAEIAAQPGYIMVGEKP